MFRKHHLFWLLPVVVLMAAVLLAAPRTSAQGPDDNIELIGVIRSFDATSIVVNGFVVDITTAEVNVTLATLLPVKVEGTLNPDQTIKAREVNLLTQDDLQPDELEIVGTLQSMNGLQAVVSGLTFDLTVAEVQAGLVIGDLVKVHASRNTDGLWIAREIERELGDDMGDDSGDDSSDDSGNDSPGDLNDDDEDFKIYGTLEEIGTGYIVISGQRIDTSRAVISDTLIIGALTKAEVISVDGVLIALEVERETGDDDMDDDSSDDSSDDSDDSDDDSSGSGSGSDDDFGDDSSGSSSDDVGVCVFEVKVSSANLRSGPGTGYDVVGFGYDDQKFPVMERDATGTWIRVQATSGPVWVATSVGELDGNCSALDTSGMSFRDDDDRDDDSSGSGSGSDDDDDRFDDSSDDSSDDDSSDSGSGSDDDDDDDSSGRGGDDDDDDDRGGDDDDD